MESVALVVQSLLVLLQSQGTVEPGVLNSAEKITEREQFVTDGHGTVDDFSLPVINIARPGRFPTNIKLSL